MTITTSRTRIGIVAGLVAGALLASGASVATASSATDTRPAPGRPAPHPKPDPKPDPKPRPTVALPVRIDLPDGFRPEGVTTAGTRVWAGSLADGAIWSGDVRTGKGAVTTPGAPGRNLRGLLAVPRSGLVWAAAGETTGDTTSGLVLGVDIRTGAIRYRIPVPGAVFLNDLTVAPGALWVTDSNVDRLTRIPLDRAGRWTGAAPTFLPLGAPWPVTEGLRANGIRTLDDGSLILDHSTSGGLWRVDPRTGTVSAIPVTGTPAITGGDGLVLLGRTLFVVRGSSRTEITRVELTGPTWGKGPKGPKPAPTGTGWTATVTGTLTGDVDVPSTAACAAGALYAVNARFGVADPGTADYWITRIPLR
ncbi:MAG: hypothetical protein U0Q15_05395 [Kineosporiaceae bacterium]